MGKILILANNDVGLYKFRKELIEELLKEHVVILSLPDGKYIEYFEKIGCKYIHTPVSRRGINPIADIKLFLNYLRIITNTKPDIVLTYTIKPNVYGGAASRIKRVPTIVNITGLGTAIESKGILQFITISLYKLSIKKAKTVFFQNKGDQKFIKDKINIKNDKLIPGSGVNIDYYKYLEYPESDNINFLFIARVMREKGIEQYLEAAKNIKAIYPNTTFHVLGYCEQNYEELLKEMQKKGLIIYHGMKDDVRKFHEISHCTIHPTFYPEGMSNVLLESASCGRPIITTNRSGCREVVDHGFNGYLVEQENSEDLIEKLTHFIELSHDEKKKMGMNGRKKIEKEFNRDIVVKEYLSVINKILR